MKNMIAITAILFTGLMSHAETMTCEFSEPFLSMTFNSQTSELTVTQSDRKDTRAATAEKAVYIKRGSTEFEIHTAGDRIILTGLVTNQATTGLTDVIYPIDVQLNTNGQTTFGGCETDSLKAIKPELKKEE